MPECARSCFGWVPLPGSASAGSPRVWSIFALGSGYGLLGCDPRRVLLASYVFSSDVMRRVRWGVDARWPTSLMWSAGFPGLPTFLKAVWSLLILGPANRAIPPLASFLWRRIVFELLRMRRHRPGLMIATSEGWKACSLRKADPDLPPRGRCTCSGHWPAWASGAHALGAEALGREHQAWTSASVHSRLRERRRGCTFAGAASCGHAAGGPKACRDLPEGTQISDYLDPICWPMVAVLALPA